MDDNSAIELMEGFAYLQVMFQIYSPSTNSSRPPAVGISEIALYQPPWTLPNAWYESLLAKKFEKHTGICSRSIAEQDEVAMAESAIDRLVAQTGCSLSDCAAVILVCPSVIPQSVARKHLTASRARREQPTRLATELADTVGMQPRTILGINGFCSGYAKALSMLQRKVIPSLAMQPNEFVLVITSSRISRITDFQCRASGALFGDFATATLLSRCDSAKYPVRFDLVDADYRKQTVPRSYFDFTVKEGVEVPTPDGGRRQQDNRIVFQLDGMGIADTAPRAMAQAAQDMALYNDLSPEQIDCIVPHQAGKGIVRLTGMKLEEAGFAVEPINGGTTETGNISSGSVPHALKNHWDALGGWILCPVAAVGAPGRPEVSRGCILLRDQTMSRAMAG